MGVIVLRDGKPYVFEAVGTVRETPWADWVARGEGKRFVVKRLRRELGREELRRMRELGQKLAGRPYDAAFEWSDDRMYCSELVWKLYQRGAGVELGHLARLGDFDLTAPEVRKKLQERYGGKIPLDEPVISPEAIFASPELVEVARGGG